MKKLLIATLAVSLLLPNINMSRVEASGVSGDNGVATNTNSQADQHASYSWYGTDITVNASARADAQASVSAGRKGTISAYLLSSVQGESGKTTYIPDVQKYTNLDSLFENKNAGVTETRYFDDRNKLPSFFKQNNTYSFDYIEGLNWLYKNNKLHNFSGLSVDAYQGSGDPYLFTQSGSYVQNTKFLVMDAGTYTIDCNFGDPDYTDKDGKPVYIADHLVATSDDGTVLVDTGMVTGRFNRNFTITKNNTKVDITVNKGDGTKGTVWNYSVRNIMNLNNRSLGTNKVNYSESGGEFIQSLTPDSTSGKVLNTISRKDFTMQLMKVSDGVIDSRPILIQSQYLMDDEIGSRRFETGTLPIMSTPFKKQAGALGIDTFLNSVDIDFSQYGMHYLYVNPNVYELYFRKALTSNIIKIDDFRTDSPFRQEFLTTDKKPRWDNSLPPVRVNQVGFSIDNNGGQSVIDSSSILGSSYATKSDVSRGDLDKSNISRSINLVYDPTYEYFWDPQISYLEAVRMLYKATLAYSDERLNKQQVDAIVSLYGVKYKGLSDSDKEAINYLIAKGIIDGNDAAKYQSGSAITVDDAVVLLYRFANPAARMTFKGNLSPLDAEMLTKGFAKSQSSVLTFNSDKETPKLEAKVDGYTDLYVLYNSKLRADNDPTKTYAIATARGTPSAAEGLKPRILKIDASNFAIDGVAPTVDKSGKYYEVQHYHVPLDLDLTHLGFTLPSSTGVSNWIALDSVSGVYSISDSDIANVTTSKDGNFAIARINSNGEITDSRLTGIYAKAIAKEKEEDATVSQPTSFLGKAKQFLLKAVDSLFGGNNKAYAADTTTTSLATNDFIKVSIIINDAAKEYLLFNNKPLYKKDSSGNLDISPEVNTKINNKGDLKIVKGTSTVTAGQTELVFNVPKFADTKPSAAKADILGQLSLTGQGIVQGLQIASYTGLENGQTMISISELKNFGVEVRKEEPDILYFPAMDSYAYLNPEKGYALIGNTLKTYPKDTVMIETPNSSDVFYNIDIVMSMLSAKDFNTFNSEGKFEVVHTLSGIQSASVYNPVTKEVDSHTYKAQGYINVTSLAGKANTFFMAFDKVRDYKRIYGFSPWYETPVVDKIPSFVTVQNMLDDLDKKTVTKAEIENIVLNNTITRMEFDTSKESRFIYSDSAVRVTEIVDDKSYDKLAKVYLDYFKHLYPNMSENDIRAYTKDRQAGTSIFQSSDFSFDSMIKGDNFINKNYAAYKTMMELYLKDKNSEAFWVMYLMDKFTPSGFDNYAKFMEALRLEYINRYPEVKDVIGAIEDLDALVTAPEGASDLRSKRVFSMYLLVPYAQVPGSWITENNLIWIQPNKSVYVPYTDYNDIKDVPGVNRNPMNELDYLGNNVRNMLGTYYYAMDDGNMYYRYEPQYKSLPSGLTPLEAIDSGTKFMMGDKEFVVVNNAFLKQQGKDTAVYVKVMETKLDRNVQLGRQEYLSNEASALGEFKQAINLDEARANDSDMVSNDEIKALIAVDNAKNVPLSADNLTSGESYFIKTVSYNGFEFHNLLAKDSNSLQSTTTFDTNTKLFFNEALLSGSTESNKGKLDGINGATELFYKSFMIKPGTVAIDKRGYAVFTPRLNNFMITRAPLNDLVNEVVKEIKSSRSGLLAKRVKDIPDGQLLKINSLGLIRAASEPDVGGYVNFITNKVMSNTVNKNELLFDKSLLISNYKLLEETKVPVGDERRSLYSLIGNVNLNIPQHTILEKYATQLQLNKNDNPVLVEDRNNGNAAQLGYYDMDFGFLAGITGGTFKGGKVNEITSDATQYKYYLSLYIDPNVEVIQNPDGSWSPRGYASEDVISLSPFLGRLSKFPGIYANNVITLPTAPNVDGGLLGFLLSKFQVDRLRDLTNLKFWDRTLGQWILEAESGLATLGIYYLYILLVLIFLGRESLMSNFYRNVFDPVRFLTFNRMSAESVSLGKTTVQILFAIILLSMMYDGLYRSVLSTMFGGVQYIANFFTR